MPAQIIPIVEGHGDVSSVPILIRRIAEMLGRTDVRIRTPIRCSRQKLVKSGELERTIDLAVRKGEGACQILVLIDAEEDCPKELAPELLRRAAAARGNVPIAVVVAKNEFEAWFLGAIDSLGHEMPTETGAARPVDPEAVRGAKERLATILGIHYSEVIDQPSMTAQFDLAEARRNCPSFDKCCREVSRLISVANDP